MTCSHSHGDLSPFSYHFEAATPSSTTFIVQAGLSDACLEIAQVQRRVV